MPDIHIINGLHERALRVAFLLLQNILLFNSTLHVLLPVNEVETQEMGPNSNQTFVPSLIQSHVTWPVWLSCSSVA